MTEFAALVDTLNCILFFFYFAFVSASACGMCDARFTLKLARMLDGAVEPPADGGLSEDRAVRLRERLAVLKVTKMDQVV